MTEALTAEASADFRQAAQTALCSLAELQAKKEAYRARVEKSWNRQPNSMPRVTAEFVAVCPIMSSSSMKASPPASILRALSTIAASALFRRPWRRHRQGLAGAIGVKVAMPDRPVVAVSGGGSAMMRSRRCGLLHTSCDRIRGAGREYRILKLQCGYLASKFRGRHPASLSNMDITGPALDFVHLATGMGVEAVRVENAERHRRRSLQRRLRQTGRSSSRSQSKENAERDRK